MNYTVVPLNGGNQFDINGVRFGEKSFMFWKKKNGQPVRDVIVVFDKKYENVHVNESAMLLSLKGLKEYNDLKQAIRIFQQIMQNQTFSFLFVVENNQERQMVESLGRELGINFKIQNMGKDETLLEAEMKERNMQAGDGQMIEKYDNGKLRQVTVQDGKAYENNGLLNTEEEKVSLLREWLQDPAKSEALSKMSVDERDQLLTRTVLEGRKEYRLESANEVVVTGKASEIAVNKASGEDGLVNTELGIVQNGVYNSSKYSMVEEDSENIRVVNSSIKNSQISADGVSSSVSTGTYLGEYTDTTLHDKGGQTRNIGNQVFYISSEAQIYDSNNQVVGILGQGYSVDYNDNTLLKDGNKIGSIGDYKDMGREQSNVYEKPKVRTLEKKEQEKSAAFVSLPVIIFILSALLLIISSVLLFIVD